MRINIKNLMSAAIVLLGAATVAAQGVDTVYVTYPDENGIFAWSTTPGSVPVKIYPSDESEVNFEDLVVGPDGDLWACDPDPITGEIVRLTPNFDINGDPEDATLKAQYELTGFQCGWFTSYGDLLVTEKFGSGVYALPAANPAIPQLVVDLGGTAQLEGLTQEADGDLLVVDRQNGSVARVSFDLNIFYPYTPPGEKKRLGWFDNTEIELDVISGLSEPAGIARSSKGGVFVTDSTGVYQYATDDLGALQPVGECPDLSFRKGQRPFFLEFAADDTLYISVTRKNTTELVRSGLDCSATVLSEIGKKILAPPVVGMAVPYLAPALDDRFIAGTEIFDSPESPLPDPDAQVFTFNDHAYEFKSDPLGCQVTASAAEATPGELADLVAEIDLAIYDPDYPACLDDDSCDVTGQPILYLGENGRGILYEVKPEALNSDGTPADPLCDGSITANLVFRHAISAFTGYVPNPRLVRCPSPGDEYECELIDLASFFPFDGIIPDDARIGGLKSSTTADFSRFFVIDLDLNDNVNTGDGYFCGFDSPWNEPIVPDWNDPDVLTNLTPDQFNQLTSINNTETFTFKFKIAQRFVDGVEIPEAEACASGPYIEGATVLMSIARVADDDFPTLTEVFSPKSIFSAGSSAEVDPAIFNEGALPNKQYNFNAKFPSDGDPTVEGPDDYAPGVYQIVLVPLTNNFAAEVRYFRIVP